MNCSDRALVQMEFKEAILRRNFLGTMLRSFHEVKNVQILLSVTQV